VCDWSDSQCHCDLYCFISAVHAVPEMYHGPFWRKVGWGCLWATEHNHMAITWTKGEIAHTLSTESVTRNGEISDPNYVKAYWRWFTNSEDPFQHCVLCGCSQSRASAREALPKPKGSFGACCCLYRTGPLLIIGCSLIVYGAWVSVKKKEKKETSLTQQNPEW